VQKDGQGVEAQLCTMMRCSNVIINLLILKFLKFVITHDVCFVQGKDSFGKMGLLLQKCMDFIKMFAYGVLTNAIDEYCL